MIWSVAIQIELWYIVKALMGIKKQIKPETNMTNSRIMVVNKNVSFTIIGFLEKQNLEMGLRKYPKPSKSSQTETTRFKCSFSNNTSKSI